MYNSEDIKKFLGTSVKELRKEKGLTQEKMAESIGLEPNGLAQIESGRKFVSADVMSRLCEAFNVAPSVLFTPKPRVILDEHINYEKEIARLLPGFSQEKLHEIYNILLVMKK
ncbi:MAG: helix-turn-helix domain-containing protein [Candidatus Gastranaerophilales bacterium]|nr:helix-turn-helix domain-containing protein [Candidatus Gastranaerophilales bacterium]